VEKPSTYPPLLCSVSSLTMYMITYIPPNKHHSTQTHTTNIPFPLSPTSFHHYQPFAGKTCWNILPLLSYILLQEKETLINWAEHENNKVYKCHRIWCSKQWFWQVFWWHSIINYLQVEDLWTKNMFDLGEGTETAQLCD